MSEHAAPGSIAANIGGIGVGLALIALILAVDLTLGRGTHIVALEACPAFVTALWAGPRRTGAVAVVAVGATFAWGWRTADPFAMAQLVRLGGIALAGTVAFAAAHLRADREQQLVAVREIADLVQTAVLREVPTRVGPAELAIRYISATANARVGGDFYEALPYDGGVRIVLGDVRGKGVGSVRLASVLVGAFRAADHDRWTPEEVVDSMDRAFERIGPADEDFATVLLLDLTCAGALRVVNCGHPPPLLLDGGPAQELRAKRSSPPIGLGPRPAVVRHHLRPGQRILAFTDGLIEARAGGRSFDLDATAARMSDGALQHAVDRLRVDLVRFLGGQLEDDTTLLLIQRALGDEQPTGAR